VNCVSHRAKGLAFDLFRKYPESDIYMSRTSREIPGTITITGKIIHLRGQFYAGHPWPGKDSQENRVRFFQSGLNAIAQQIRSDGNGKVSIAFPFNIGCGLGGGKWRVYEEALKKFARVNSDILRLVVYRLPRVRMSGVKRERRRQRRLTDYPSKRRRVEKKKKRNDE